MTTTRPVVVLGAGGTAADILEFLGTDSGSTGLSCVAVLDDDSALHGSTIAGATVEGPLSEMHRWPDAMMIDALGSPGSFRRRPDIMAGLDVSPERFATVIHPQATVSPSATVGAGSLIYPYTMIGPGVTVGEHTIVLSHSVINHDGCIGAFGILASHVALGGRVRVGHCCYVGMGASVIQDCTLGDQVLVGMGSVVVDDVPAGLTVAGNPARPLHGSSAEPPG